jgi:hypothetical protein
MTSGFAIMPVTGAASCWLPWGPPTLIPSSLAARQEPEARVNASSWPGWLTGEEQAAPGVGEEMLVAFGAPAPLAYQD